MNETLKLMLLLGVPAAAGCLLAHNKNRDPIMWAPLCGVFPLAILVLCFMKRIPLNLDTLFCPNCGEKAAPHVTRKGHIVIELILWLAAIIPGLIYSIWRRSNRKQQCPSCNAPNMIPLGSPRAKQMLSTMDTVPGE